MELNTLSNITKQGARVGVFGTFLLVLMAFTFDTWVHLEVLGNWILRMGIPLGGVSHVFRYLGQHPEALFGMALLSGAVSVVLLFSEQIERVQTHSRFTKKQQGDKQIDKSGGGIAFLIIVFIVIRGGMIFVYDGTYVDEYQSVVSGQNVIQQSVTEPSTLYGNNTQGGGLVSVLVGLSVTVFGEHVWAITFIPFLISLGGVILLTVIGKHVFRSSTTITLLILLYTFSPWLIFQHFYARPYVLYEFIVLLLLVIAFRVINALRIRQTWSVVGWGSALLLLPFGMFFLLEEEGGVILLLLTSILISYISLFELQNIFDTQKSENRGIGTKSRNSFPRILLLYKVIFLLVLGTVIFLVFDIHQSLQHWMTSDAIGSSTQDYVYLEFFLDTHGIFTVFFFLSLLTLILPDREHVFSTITIIAAFVLFFLHITVNSDSQSIRAVIYMLPLFFVGILFAVERFSVRPIIGILAPMLLLNTLIGSYPNTFFSGPYIPDEVRYVDYKKAFTFAKEQCQNRTVVYGGPSPYSGSFYGMKPDYAVQSEQSVQRLRAANTSNVVPNTQSSSITVINTSAQVQRMTNNPYCYIEYQPGREVFISEDHRRILLDEASDNGIQKFQNISVFVSESNNSI